MTDSITPISIPTPPQTKTFAGLERSRDLALTRTDAIALAGRCDGGKWIMSSLSGELSNETRGRMSAAIGYVYDADLELTRLAVLDCPHFGAAKEALRTLSGLDHDQRQQLMDELYRLKRMRKLEIARLTALGSQHFFKLSGDNKEALQELSGFNPDDREMLETALSQLGCIQAQRANAKRRAAVRNHSPHSALVAA